MSTNPPNKRWPYKRTLRKKVIDILKNTNLFKGVIYEGRIQQLEPTTEMPCAIVYALSDTSDVALARQHNGYQREGTITLEVQIISQVPDQGNWQDSVEELEQGVIDLFHHLQAQRKIDDCIKYFTLDGVENTVDVNGDEPYASSRITYQVTYDEDLGIVAEDDFLQLNYQYQLEDGVEGTPVVENEVLLQGPREED